MKISDLEQVSLRDTFVNTNLFVRVKAQILEEVSSDVIGSSRTLENIALDLAVEKGVSLAFQKIEDLAKVSPQMVGSVSPKHLIRKTTPKSTE